MNGNWPSDASEARRLAILASYPVERCDLMRQLDGLAKLAAEMCNTPIGLVSLVEADRQRFVGRAGTDLAGTAREHAFCDLGRLADDGMIVPDAREDERFRHNPLVTGEPGIRLYASQPLRSQEGAPLGTLCVVDTKPRIDITARQMEGLRALAEAAMSMLERWRLDSASRAQAALSKTTISDLEQRFRVLADAMPQMVWSSLPSGYADYFNSRWRDYTGAPAEASHGDNWMQFLHRDDKQNVASVWHGAVAAGDVYEVEYRLRRSDGEYGWMLARGLPLRDDAGHVSRWLGTCTDIQEQKAQAEQHQLLTRELSHRIKNIFAVLGGLITLSMRRHPELKDMGSSLQQRVLALGRAHDFVRPPSEQSRSWHSHSSLRGMLGNLLGAYEEWAGQRIHVSGNDVTIDDRSATPLALFFHELATNAAKYGALSAEQGRVAIEIGPLDEAVALCWTETGGPQVTAAGGKGFGATLIEMSVTRQLGGRLRYDWRPEGLRVEARIPKQMMAR